MIIPDVNLLLYAYDSDSPYHKKAADWWKACVGGKEVVGIPAVVLTGFLRIVTNPRVFEAPMPVKEAAQQIRAWLQYPRVQVLEFGGELFERMLTLVEDLGTAGNLVTDAQIAATALAYGGTVHTMDTDFVRFAGVRWFNPITGLGSGSVRRS